MKNLKLAIFIFIAVISQVKYISTAKHAIYKMSPYKKAEECKIPDFIKSNDDYFDSQTGKINMKNVNKLWKMVKFQAVLKHGKELDKPPAEMNVFDRMYFELKYFLTCLHNKLRY